MRINRLYSNRPDVFPPIAFNAGLSVVSAEIRLPENRDKHTHNLGKTTIGQVLDFCLLRTRHPTFFLFKHAERFVGFVFYLEIELDSHEWVTIARPVDNASKIALRRAGDEVGDASELGPDAWDHLALPFDRAKKLLDSWMNFLALRPWTYRKLVGYLVREQDDYRDVFQLGKFSGKHSEWKPFVAHLLGLDSELVGTLYREREAVEDARSRLRTLADEWGTSDADTTEIDALIEIRTRDLERKRADRDRFNFNASDAEKSRELVEEIEAEISLLNEERYVCQRDLDRIETSLSSDTIVFRTRDAERIFRESGVAFQGQIKHTFDELIAFNRRISEERSSALRLERAATSARVAEIEATLTRLNAERASSLDYLRDSETMSKFRAISDEISVLEGQLQVLQGRRGSAVRLAELRQELRTHEESASALRTKAEKAISAESAASGSRFALIRRYFGEIVRAVVHEDAIIGARFNDAGGLDFYAEFIDGAGEATSADRGTTYRKLLCIAFDLAVLRAYVDEPFPRFAFHDGAFEQLEERPRRNLLNVFREYSDLGLQPIVTALDEDLPADMLGEGDVVRTLHDEGADGLLFRMDPW